MVGVIEKRLSLLLVRFKNHPEIHSALMKVATRTHTSNDIKLLTKIIRLVYFTSSLTGYFTQSRVVRKTVTHWGQNAAIAYAVDKAVSVVDKIEDTLTKAPQYVGITKQLIEDNAVREGFAKGQQDSAEEHNLQWKMWMRVRDPVTGERRPHSALEGTIIPAKELFTLPSGIKVQGPHDWENCPDPGEHINCGHSIIFTSYATREELRESLKKK